jgi:hypothetical protein
MGISLQKEANISLFLCSFLPHFALTKQRKNGTILGYENFHDRSKRPASAVRGD